jgi:hypothetical protein
MTNDLDNLRRMLDSMNIPYETDQFNNQTLIKITRGYANHYTLFTFDLDGKFNDVGAFE